MDSTRIHGIYVIGEGIDVGAAVSKVGALIGFNDDASTRKGRAAPLLGATPHLADPDQPLGAPSGWELKHA